MRPFDLETQQRIDANGRDEALNTSASEFMKASIEAKYSYNFTWLGRPIIQYPQDILAMQELIWKVQPDLIIETGIAHGGSLIFSASLLELNAACGGPVDAEVVAVDIDIRTQNRDAIERHPMFKRISMIEGSSIDPNVIAAVKTRTLAKTKVMVCLDSNHTHDHVLAELHAYASLTTIGSYCVVFDTIVDDLPATIFSDRPWAPGDSPKSAVVEFLREHPEFSVDQAIDRKLLISVAPGGYLKRIA